jgi:cytoskeletal protein CcmA (bactofilin family)
MFNSNPKKLSEGSKIDTIIGPSSTLKGTITCTGTIRVDGNHIGDIFSQEDIIIGESGSVKGNLSASSISVSGLLEGNVCARGLLEILPTGKLLGDVEVKNISIGDGAVFNGRCSTIILKEENKIAATI